jgi:hypothetical protein
MNENRLTAMPTLPSGLDGSQVITHFTMTQMRSRKSGCEVIEGP